MNKINGAHPGNEKGFVETMNWIKDPSSPRYVGYLVNNPAVTIQANTLEELKATAKESCITWLKWMLEGVQKNPMELREFKNLSEWLGKDQI